MTRIFLSYAPENVACAEVLRTDLETHSYTTYREPFYPNPTSASYPRMIENAILGSAAIVLIWSQQAAQAAWVERHLLIAQSLKKPIFPIALDNTSLPNTLVAASPPLIQTDCSDTVRALLAVATFPPTNSTDALITLFELASHEYYIRERKAAIKQAADLLAQSQHTDEVLALLTYLAKNDMIMGVREEAQKVLDAHTPQAVPSQPAFQPQDAQYIFGVRCKNGHVSYFDKRVVCSAYKSFPRLVEQSKKPLDELLLTCDTCGVEIVAYVDCEGL